MHEEDGSIGYAEFRIGDSIVMAVDARPGWPDMPGLRRLYVEDTDAARPRALQSGAQSVTEMAELYFGDYLRREIPRKQATEGYHRRDDPRARYSAPVQRERINDWNQI